MTTSTTPRHALHAPHNSLCGASSHKTGAGIPHRRGRTILHLAFVCAVPLGLAGPALAQDASGATTVMNACRPIAATGATIRADLTGAGWMAVTPGNGAGDLRDLVGSHMWSFTDSAPAADQFGLVNDYVVALTASLNNPEFGQIYTRDGQVSVVLNQGENISCFWPGSDDAAFLAQVGTIGGFPGPADAAPPVTARIDQTVEAGGRDWRRVESYARLSEDTRAGPYPAAATLGRSPFQ